MAASGGPSDVERLFRRGRGQDFEPGLAEDDAQRAQDLRLVVADENPLPGAHVTTTSLTRPRDVASLGSGNWNTNVLPSPGTDSARSRPPLASTKPRAIARPSPEPPLGSPIERWNGSKMRSSSSPAMPGP